jgi:hypothetical protein
VLFFYKMEIMAKDKRCKSVQHIKLVGLCASHIDSGARLHSLGRMLESVDRQTLGIELHLSVSCGMTVDESACKDALTLWTTQYKWLKALYRGARSISQFEHYALLQSEVADDAWCLFTDDDDEWHANRAARYAQAIIEEGHNGHSDPPVQEATTELVVDAVDVVACTAGRLYYDGSLRTALRRSEWNPDNVMRPTVPCEYFEFSIRSTCFKRFFALAMPMELALRGCDLIFRNYLMSLPCMVFRAPEDWLYFQHGLSTRRVELERYLGDAASAWKRLQMRAGIQVLPAWTRWIYEDPPAVEITKLTHHYMMPASTFGTKIVARVSRVQECTHNLHVAPLSVPE